jgi:acyl dehydratase
VYFEDLDAGYQTSVGEYRLESEEIIEFARRWDPYPFHTDERAASESIFGGLTASSCHLFAICTALFHRDPNPIAVLAMLGKDEIRFPKPDRGIVTLADALSNHEGLPILTQRVSLMVARRPAAPTA